MKYKKVTIVIAIYWVCIGKIAFSQSSPVWIFTYSDINPIGMVLTNSESEIMLWGNGVDLSCNFTAAALVRLDTAGILLKDSTFELNSCADEIPKFCNANISDHGIYLITQNNVSTPADSSFVYYIDSSMVIQWSQYIGYFVRSDIHSYENRGYTSSDFNGTNKQVLRFNSQGTLDTLNQVTQSYFMWAPQILLFQGNGVLEVGFRPDADTAFLCSVYDTLGNYQNSFAFDADGNNQEVPQFMGVNSGQIFQVSAGFTSKTYPGCLSISGATNWLDTLYHSIHNYDGACLDSINQVGYVLCDGAGLTKYLFSYNLLNGVLIDSIVVDSVDAIFTGIKTGPAGGVYFMYNKTGVNQITIDQYDQSLTLMWSGYAMHPTCSTPCDPQDFVIDGNGYVYTVSDCGGMCNDPVLVVKFAPSLVDVNEITSPNKSLNIVPNPGTSKVVVTVEDENITSQLLVCDPLGRVVQQIDFCGSSCVIDVGSLHSGIYFIELYGAAGTYYTGKLMVHHQ